MTTIWTPEEAAKLDRFLRSIDETSKSGDAVTGPALFACADEIRGLMARLGDGQRSLSDYHSRLEVAGAMQGHDAPCHYCGKPCNCLAGNPSEWPIPLCHADDPGRVKWHHTGCVEARISYAEERSKALDRVMAILFNIVPPVPGEGAIAPEETAQRVAAKMSANPNGGPNGISDQARQAHSRDGNEGRPPSRERESLRLRACAVTVDERGDGVRNLGGGVCEGPRRAAEDAQEVSGAGVARDWIAQVHKFLIAPMARWERANGTSAAPVTQDEKDALLDILTSAAIHIAPRRLDEEATTLLVHLSKNTTNPSPSGHLERTPEASGFLSTEASGPVGLGPCVNGVVNDFVLPRGPSATKDAALGAFYDAIGNELPKNPDGTHSGTFSYAVLCAVDAYVTAVLAAQPKSGNSQVNSEPKWIPLFAAGCSAPPVGVRVLVKNYKGTVGSGTWLGSNWRTELHTLTHWAELPVEGNDQ